MDPATAASEFYAIDDQIVVLANDFGRIGQEEIDVFGSLGRGKGVMGGCESGGPALTGFGSVRGREERKVGDPEGFKAGWGLEVALLYG